MRTPCRRAAAAALLLACAACADWRAPPVYALAAGGQPLVQEQALLGVAEDGGAAAAQLVLAEGEEPRLSLLAFAADGRSSRELERGPLRAARAVAARLLAEGRRALPLLAAAVAADWPEALEMAADLGYRAAPPTPPEPGRRRWPLAGATGLPLVLRLADARGDPPALALVLGDAPGGEPSGEEVELARLLLSGEPVAPAVWLRGGVAWLLAGSVRGGARGEPLLRTVALRRGSLPRGEAELHNLHGLADYAAGDLDAARREFERALAADDLFLDALYNAASVAALGDRVEEAVALLRRAAAVDPRRVQVLGRNDPDLKGLRGRADVRALLGLDRAPPPGN